MAIQANAEIALKYPEGIRLEDAERFQAVVSASRQMQHLTEDLLLLARTDQTIHPRPKILDISDLLRHLVQLYIPRAEYQQICLTAYLVPNIFVLGEGNQLNHLFTNLLANALKYTPHGGKVDVSLRQQRGHVFVEVRDTGIGMAPDDLEHVFDRFWRAEQSRSCAGSEVGAGLGLAIAESIAHSHHGKIQVQSQVGQGSTFTVRLPMAAANRQ
jgi:signal transduction histidine kinase